MGSCEASARRGLRPVGSWRGQEGVRSEDGKSVCVCVREREQWGGVESGRERKTASGSCPCPYHPTGLYTRLES